MSADDQLVSYFETFIKNKPLFLNKKSLQSDFTPDKIEHREECIKSLAEILAPSLRFEKPSNIFIYGKTGTGKTLTVNYTLNRINKVAEHKNIPILAIYVNCRLKKVADTEYRLIAEIVSKLGKDLPSTGLPTSDIYKEFFSIVDQSKRIVIIVLDEVDQLVEKSGNEVLYSLTRINSELKNAQISFIGISNDILFVDALDSRVKSSLSEEEILFNPYNASQLKDILESRSKIAFNEGVISQGVIAKCAAYAAREHGDARRALELLRVSAEIAERKNLNKVHMEHVDEAEQKIEKDRILDALENHPKQFHTVLYSIFSLYNEKRDYIHTGEVYDLYKEICHKSNSRPLTQRRVSDIIGEYDILGIIAAKTISKGRYGRTREILLSLPESLKQKIEVMLKNKLGMQ